MHCRLDYGAAQPQPIERLELVMPVDGLVDTAFSETGKGGMAAADTWECSLPTTRAWSGRAPSHARAGLGRFVPWFWFGSGDRGFTWFCDSSRAGSWTMPAPPCSSSATRRARSRGACSS